MTDRTLIPAPPLEPGEVVQCPSGRVGVVRSVTAGEVTVALAPTGELAAFRRRWLARPYAEPAHLVFIGLPDQDEAANDADADPGPVAP